jgi:hypothetical protein
MSRTKIKEYIFNNRERLSEKIMDQAVSIKEKNQICIRYQIKEEVECRKLDLRQYY